jgi:osmotically-inducible protein OsmY
MKPLRRGWSLLLPLLLAVVAGCKKGRPSHSDAVTSAQTSVAALPPNPIRDALLREAIEASLARDPGVEHHSLRVDVAGGLVTLEGTVSNLLSKRRAVRLVEGVKGVRRVSDRCELSVRPRPDSELAHNLRNLLWFSQPTATRDMEVEVRDGAVILKGHAESRAQARFAERLAEGITGVRSVRSEVAIRPGAERSDEDMAAAIGERLRWDALVDDGLIVVEVRAGTVRLSGTVKSAAERRRALEDAWVPGVRDVDGALLEVRWWVDEALVTRRKPRQAEGDDIARAIRATSAHDARLRDSTLHVSVKRGAARLSGYVASARAKRVAEELARQTVGVLQVENRLEVKAQPPLGDRSLESIVAGALSSNPHTDGFRLEVQASAGRLVLRGSVDTTFQRALAGQLASGIRGVRQVDNELSVAQPELVYTYDPYAGRHAPFARPARVSREPARPDDAIAQAIRNELRWSPFVDANQIQVSVSRGEATLTGQVGSPSERRAARKNAYQGGALTVDDRLTIESDG